MSDINVVKIIESKSQGLVLNSEEIRSFVRCVHEKSIDDAQIGIEFRIVYCLIFRG